MQMFEYGSETDENQHLVEFTLDFMVNEVLVDVTFDSDYMDLFLVFLERLLKIQKLKYVTCSRISLENCENRVAFHEVPKNVGATGLDQRQEVRQVLAHLEHL